MRTDVGCADNRNLGRGKGLREPGGAEFLQTATATHVRIRNEMRGKNAEEFHSSEAMKLSARLDRCYIRNSGSEIRLSFVVERTHWNQSRALREMIKMEANSRFDRSKGIHVCISSVQNSFETKLLDFHHNPTESFTRESFPSTGFKSRYALGSQNATT